MKEQWRKIEGYDNYRVSNLGEVKNIKDPKKPFYLSQFYGTKGHATVTLNDGRKQKQFLVNKLVINAFKKDLIGKQISHKDGDLRNNRLDNLEARYR